jgi:hypothetical protein
MSARLMGAIVTCGPGQARLRLALLAIADAADDFGFAVLSIEKIAERSVCNRRTAMRLVQTLEREGWMCVRRRAVGGRVSVYFVDAERLGVRPDQKSRKSEMHRAFEKKSGDKVPGEGDRLQTSAYKALRKSSPQADGVGGKRSGELSSDVENVSASETSGDNPQGVQVTPSAKSGDKMTGPFNSFNRFNPINPNYSPLPPSLASGVECVLPIGDCTVEMRKSFHAAMRDVRDALILTEENLGPRRPTHLAGGYADWKGCFDDLTPLRWDQNGRLVVESDNPGAAAKGLQKYAARIRSAMQRHFGRAVELSLCQRH